MEVRIIKTCHGLTELRFLDGALLPADGASIVEVCEARYQEAIEQEWAIAKHLPENRVDFLDLRYWKIGQSTRQTLTG